MRYRDWYDGAQSAFEGDRTLWLRGLPAGAIIKKATLTITPVAAPGAGPFVETIDFRDPTDPQRTLGATKLTGAGFVEVDFHKRRTLASVTGAAGANLQIDLGGIYLQINDKGAVLTPTDPTPFAVPADGTLPGLTLSKFKLTATGGIASPDVTSMTIRSVPTNVSVRLGKLGPFWTSLGESAMPATSPDFSSLLQTFLTTAAVDQGHYVVPLVVHSDTVARLRVDADIEFLQSASLTPDGLSEVLLPFDFSSVAKFADSKTLGVSLPPDAVVVSADTAARASGAFDDTRVVEGYGPTGNVSATGSVLVSPADAQAQPLEFERAVIVGAIDVLVNAQTTVQLGVDLRDDLDGKPDHNSLLGAPAKFTVNGSSANAPSWVSVTLPQQFTFVPAAPPHNGRYWIVLQSFDGTASWSVGNAQTSEYPMQHSVNDGLSWRASPLAPGAAAFYRLRSTPDRFSMPIELQIGSGDAATRVKLDRFAPLGRVDLSLNIPELAAGFNTYLSREPPRCSQSEHVLNGDFSQWLTVGTALGTPAVLDLAVTSEAVASPDGRYVYAGTAGQIAIMDALRDEPATSVPLNGNADPVLVTMSPDGSRLYVVDAAGTPHVVDTASRADLGANAVRAFPGVRDAIVSRDGNSLAIASSTTIETVDIASLEAGAGIAVRSSQAANLAGIANSPGGDVIYAASANGEFQVLDFDTLNVQEAIPLGNGLSRPAITPDGTLAVVAGAANKIVWFIDLRTASVTGEVGVAPATPQAVTISPDGAFAYVALRTATNDSAIGAIDLQRRRWLGVQATFSSGASGAIAARAAVAAAPSVYLAITPTGNRLYLADPAARTLASVSRGTLTPADWTAFGTAKVGLTALSFPTVFIGDLSRTGAQESAISQVVPLAEDCTYLFRFAAAGTNAKAEVFWLSDACGLLRADQIPIAKARRGMLAPYSAKLQAPPQTVQAEVRFSAAPGSAAEIAAVSLAGSTDKLSNGDFQASANGVPSGWTLTPAADRSGFHFTTSSSGAQSLSNASAETIRLAQQFDISGVRTIELEFDGAIAREFTADPAIEIQFYAADSTPLQPAIKVTVSSLDFQAHFAQADVPAAAATAELRISLPPASELLVQRILIRPRDDAQTPVAFISQAPGELKVSNARVAYDRVTPSPAGVPASGLCKPTPPGASPGEQCDERTCYCMQCKAQRMMTQPSAAKSMGGRPATIAQCASCGSDVFQIGGTMSRAAGSFPFASVAVGARLVPDEARPGPRAAPAAPPAAAPTPITSVRGIGEKRARILAAANITTVEQLASATPARLTKTVPGLSLSAATLAIKDARRLTLSAPTSRERK